MSTAAAGGYSHDREASPVAPLHHSLALLTSASEEYGKTSQCVQSGRSFQGGAMWLQSISPSTLAALLL